MKSLKERAEEYAAQQFDTDLMRGSWGSDTSGLRSARNAAKYHLLAGAEAMREMVLEELSNIETMTARFLPPREFGELVIHIANIKHSIKRLGLEGEDGSR